MNSDLSPDGRRSMLRKNPPAAERERWELMYRIQR
jgi:hypothetical protein